MAMGPNGPVQAALLHSVDGSSAAAVPDRREQRRLDQAAGLIPFAVKLNRDLVAQVNALALERKLPVNDVVAELLQAALKK
jgi:hypothetical protein